MGALKFDFSPVLSVVTHKGRQLLESKSKESHLKVLMKDVFSLPHLRRYLALYVAGDMTLAIESRKQVQKPASLTVLYNQAYSRFTSPDERGQRDYLREQGVYPLTPFEMKQAQEVYTKSEVLIDAIAAFQAGLGSYLLDMETYAEVYGYDNNYPVCNFLTRIRSAVNAFTLIHDFVPALAQSFAEQGWQGDEDFSEEGFHIALHSAFRKQFFKSAEPVEETINHCPFGPLIGHIFNTVLEYQDDGTLIALDETRPGAFPYFLTQKVAFDREVTQHRVDLWLTTLQAA